MLPPMTSLEPVAVLFGIVSVWLSVKERIWAWPTSLVNVLLYFVIFGQQRLYAQSGLQLFYAGIALYGWYHWRFGGAEHTPLRVSRTPSGWRLTLPLFVVTFAVALGWTLARFTDAALPWLDAALTAGSLCAQFMMSRKYLENWALWVALDVVYIGLWISRGLYLTAFLYAAFLLLAALGHVEWTRSLRAARAGA